MEQEYHFCSVLTNLIIYVLNPIDWSVMPRIPERLSRGTDMFGEVRVMYWINIIYADRTIPQSPDRDSQQDSVRRSVDVGVRTNCKVRVASLHSSASISTTAHSHALQNMISSTVWTQAYQIKEHVRKLRAQPPSALKLNNGAHDHRWSMRWSIPVFCQKGVCHEWSNAYDTYEMTTSDNQVITTK